MHYPFWPATSIFTLPIRLQSVVEGKEFSLTDILTDKHNPKTIAHIYYAVKGGIAKNKRARRIFNYTELMHEFSREELLSQEFNSHLVAHILDFLNQQPNFLPGHPAPLTHFYSPTEGWGNRLVSALAYNKANPQSQVNITVNDVNKELTEAYKKIIKLHNTSAKTIIVKNEPAEIIDLTTITAAQNLIDVVVAGIPFFNAVNYEVNNKASQQSASNYSQLDNWLNKFVKPMIANTLMNMRAGGVFVINIDDIKSCRNGKVFHLVKGVIEAINNPHILPQVASTIDKNNIQRPVIEFCAMAGCATKFSPLIFFQKRVQEPLTTNVEQIRCEEQEG
jgi:hypothetical protein